MKIFQNNRLIKFLEYSLILVVLLCMFFFMLPQSDIFWFSRQTESDLNSVFNGALYYGNGRLIGNFIGMFFSHNFQYAFILVAFSLFLIIISINYLVFDSNKYTVIPLALLVAFPSSGVLNEIYFLLASFINFAFPCVLFLLNACIFKYLHVKRPTNLFLKIVLIFLSCVFSAASCLFSENTSIIVVCFIFLLTFYSMMTEKKIKPVYLFNVLASLAGTALMFVIPVFTRSSENMSNYRTIAFGISGMLASFVRFSEVLINQTVIMALVSLALIYLCCKESKLGKKIKVFICSYLAVFPVAGFAIRELKNDLYLSRANMASLCLVLMFFFCAFVIVVTIKDKKTRFKCLLFSVLLMSSIAPMMLVTQYGYRTYYLTILILLVFALVCLKKAFYDVEIKQIINKLPLKTVASSFSTFSTVAFVLVAVMVCIQMVYNFNFFVLRTDMIREQIEEVEMTGAEDEYIEAFALPGRSFCVDIEHRGVVFDIIGSGRPDNMRTVDIMDSKVSKEVLSMVESSFFSNLGFAFDHLDYRDAYILLDI